MCGGVVGLALEALQVAQLAVVEGEKEDLGVLASPGPAEVAGVPGEVESGERIGAGAVRIRQVGDGKPTARMSPGAGRSHGMTA